MGISNPCKICIIRAMCKDPCDNFVSYLKILCDDDSVSEEFHDITAKRIRNGSAEIKEKRIHYYDETDTIIGGAGRSWVYQIPVKNV